MKKKQKIEIIAIYDQMKGLLEALKDIQEEELMRFFDYSPASSKDLVHITDEKTETAEREALYEAITSITKACEELKKIIDTKHGEIHLRIEEVLQEKGISKNKICKDLNIPRYTFNRYCKNEIQFLDTDFLSRLCCYLQIGIQDLFVYLPTKS